MYKYGKVCEMWRVHRSVIRCDGCFKVCKPRKYKYGISFLVMKGPLGDRAQNISPSFRIDHLVSGSQTELYDGIHLLPLSCVPQVNTMVVKLSTCRIMQLSLQYDSECPLVYVWCTGQLKFMAFNTMTHHRLWLISLTFCVLSPKFPILNESKSPGMYAQTSMIGQIKCAVIDLCIS